MSITLAVIVFVFGLAVSIVSSLVLAKRVDQLGTWMGLSEGLLGVLTALGADAPEIASAVTAVVGGHHDLGLGVVFGSNIVNLAALLGGSAMAAGCVRVRRAGLWFDGGVGLLVAVVVAVRLFGWIGNAWAVVILCLVLPPYLVISGLKPAYVKSWTRFPRAGAWLQYLLVETAHEKATGKTPPKPSTTDLLGVVPSLVAVVVGSVGMVKAAIVLADAWRIPHAVLGMLALATLTGIPNIIAAIRLALHGRGTAVVSETLNSNNVNLLVGVMVPVLIVGVGTLTARASLAIVWSLAMTVLALVLASLRKGLTRVGGGILLAVYLAFVVVVVWMG